MFYKLCNANISGLFYNVIKNMYSENDIHIKVGNSLSVQYVLKRVSFGSKDCIKELKLECAYFLGQTS